jgi:DNA-binding NarL/FixJ family response regulator
MKKLRILIIDDHKMVRDGIRSMLESQEKKYKFSIEEAEDGEEGVAKAKNQSYDIIIMDYQLPRLNGAEAAELIMASKPKAKILALSSYNEYMYIDRMMKIGAKGFVLKNIGPEELIRAVETILNGNDYYSSEIALKILNFDNYITQASAGGELDILSKREVEILKLIANEYTNEQIAQRLNLSRRTVDKHRQNLLNKLHVRNTAGLVKYAVMITASTANEK